MRFVVTGGDIRSRFEFTTRLSQVSDTPFLGLQEVLDSSPYTKIRESWAVQSGVLNLRERQLVRHASALIVLGHSGELPESFDARRLHKEQRVSELAAIAVVRRETNYEPIFIQDTEQARAEFLDTLMRLTTKETSL